MLSVFVSVLSYPYPPYCLIVSKSKPLGLGSGVGGGAGVGVGAGAGLLFLAALSRLICASTSFLRAEPLREILT